MLGNRERGKKGSDRNKTILTIYFLGFYISLTLPAVIKVNRTYTDILQGKEIQEKNDFIENLTHDSYVIQIPAMHVKLRNPLERILSIFQQEKFIDDDHHFKSYDYEADDELMRTISNFYTGQRC